MDDPSPTHACPPRILIVDDDPASIVLLTHILENEGRVAVATSGEAALQSAREHRPDLVLLDAQMPGLSGFDTCRVLLADPHTAEVPVIFVTGHAGTAEETRALEIGAVDFISKPVNPPVVRARVRTHLALKHKTDALRRLSTTDALTGIANRRAFDDALEKEWRRAMRYQYTLSLLLVDIDHFKRYNDLHGHPAGDACLRQVAAILGASTQRAGDLAARYGGEEFAVILPHAEAADAQGFAQRLCASVSAHGLPHGDSPVGPHVSVSIGVASMVRPCQARELNLMPCRNCYAYEACRTAPQALVTLADQALYRAKRNGRAQVAWLGGVSEPVPA